MARNAVDPSAIAVTTGMGGEAYAQWVRRAIRRAVDGCGSPIALFDSSVEEPVELLRRTVAVGFAAPITSRYQSVFVNGNPFVVDTLASRYNVPADHILCTTGATGALSLLYRTFLSAGDHVLVETPGFDLFADIGKSLGADVELFERKGPRYDLNTQDIARQLRPNTRLVVISNLHNPSGMLLRDEALAGLARAVDGHGVKVIVDEVYGDYADLAARPGAAIRLSPNFISISSLTKIYGLSTLRCGWIVADPETLAPVRTISDRFEFGVSKLSHAVAALVLEGSAVFDANAKSVLALAQPIIERYYREWAEEGLIEGELPEFGCISFPKLVGIDDTQAFSAWLADRSGVIVAPGEFFGAPGHVRIGHAHSPKNLECGLSKFTEGLRSYRSANA